MRWEKPCAEPSRPERFDLFDDIETAPEPVLCLRVSIGLKVRLALGRARHHTSAVQPRHVTIGMPPGAPSLKVFEFPGQRSAIRPQLLGHFFIASKIGSFVSEHPPIEIDEEQSRLLAETTLAARPHQQMRPVSFG
jgi:hypothetical protein